MKLLRKKDQGTTTKATPVLTLKKPPTINNGRTLKPKSMEERFAVKARKKPTLEKSQCMFHMDDGTRCKGSAVGRGTLCQLHGGNRMDGIEPIPFAERAISVIGTTKFDPSYHPIRFIELSREGLSDVEIAAEFSICMATLKNWSVDIKEFAIAYDIGRTMYEAYFLKVGRRNLTNDRFNNSMFKYLTMNKLGYSDKVETKSFNTSLHGVLLVPPEMTMDDWEAANVARDAEKEKNQLIEQQNEEVA